MSEFDDDVPLYDLGVLLVHGIGQSGRGETLLRFGQPLRAAIESVAAPETPPAGIAPEARAVTVAVWRATLEPDDGDGPAHAELLIAGAALSASGSAATGAPGDSGESRWLMAEAWWSKKFPTPTFGDIVSFAFEILPWTLIAHFDRRFRRNGFALHAALENNRHLWRIPALCSRWFVEGFKVTLMLALSPLLLIAIGSLVLLGALPIAPVRNFAGAVQRTLAATVGDSFVFMQQPFTGAAICQSVTSDLEWLAARCKKVVVVAHSQGGAIAHRVLRGPVTAPCDLLVTFGSGLAKLAEMERTSVPHGHGLLWLATLGISIAAASLVFHAISMWPTMPVGASVVLTLLPAFIVVMAGLLFAILDLMTVPDRSSEQNDKPRNVVPALRWTVAFVLTACAIIAGTFAYGGPAPNYWMGILAFADFAGGLALAYGSLRAWHVASGRSLNPRNQWSLDREVYRERFQFHNRRLDWYDFYASDDPVPNGRLLDDFEPRELYSSEFSNARSSLLDHTSYWQNQDEFVARVTRLLLKTAGIKVQDGTHAHTVQRRRWRVGWRVVARWTLTILTLLLALDWWTSATPEPVGRFMQELMSFLDDAAKPGKTAPAWLSPWLFLTLIWAIATATARASWGFWNAGDIRCSMADGRYASMASRFRLFAAIIWLWCAAALWALSGFQGLAALLVVTVVGAGAQWITPWHAWLVFHSAADLPAQWRRLRLERWRRAARRASEKQDPRDLTWLGRQLLDEDNALALQALTQASTLGSANAAWTLGLHFDQIAGRLGNVPAGAEPRQRAIDAFARGAELGDQFSARFLAYSYEKINNREAAIAAYRKAFDLGDVAAAHSLGWLLWKENETEAQALYEAGVSRGDPLSARFLATQLEQKARELKASDPVTAAGFEARALELYRKAFAMGEVDAARHEGNLLREQSKIAEARHAYAAGVRLRDALSALRLGELEEEEAQDDDAAGTMYIQAIRLDRGAGIGAQARFRQGRIAQRNEKLRAAINYYRGALGVSDSKFGVAQAAVALGELLAEARANRSDILTVYERGMALDPVVTASPYVEFLAKSYALDEAVALYSKGVDKFPASALLGLGRALKYRDPTAARDLFERALLKDSPEAAMELYKVCSMNGGSAAANSLFDVVLTKPPWFAQSLAALLEKDNQKVAADELRNRAKAGGGPFA